MKLWVQGQVGVGEGGGGGRVGCGQITISSPPSPLRPAHILPVASSLAPVAPTPLSPLKVPQNPPPTLKPPPLGNLSYSIQQKIHT